VVTARRSIAPSGPSHPAKTQYRVNLIAAGFVDTPLSAASLGDAFNERREQLRVTLPIRRVVVPEDVAALAVHVMANTALTGATFDVDGGQQIA
jgi:NAD(P)-dependent dehydrogenase (short-subunit alcohol dehydrogenase family)